MVQCIYYCICNTVGNKYICKFDREIPWIGKQMMSYSGLAYIYLYSEKSLMLFSSH